ncbi:MAG: hypothetical protein WBO10_02710 [Pyrinomonadaceae bacterium]
MTSEEMLKEIAALPVGARHEIEDMIARLRAAYSRRNTGQDKFEDDPFFGMWNDREDMTDSTAWVRSIREKHWAN